MTEQKGMYFQHSPGFVCSLLVVPPVKSRAPCSLLQKNEKEKRKVHELVVANRIQHTVHPATFGNHVRFCLLSHHLQKLSYIFCSDEVPYLLVPAKNLK